MKEVYMNRAIELAERGIGFVNPDPLRGAVIVKNGRIIGEGYYKAYNSESAESMALKNARGLNDGAELYVNMEPDFRNKGFGSPVDSIIESGIRKVYIGMSDPDLNNDGKAIDSLKKAGVEVEIDILKDKCSELNEIYAHYIVRGTPFVFTKWAMTLDGKLASRTGDSKWISGEESLKFVHRLRQRVAAIMVGENTVRQDNPLLTTRLKGVEISNPLRVILSKYGDIPSDANVLKVDDRTKTLIIASLDISKDREESFISKGIEVLKLQENNGRIEFKEIINALGTKKIDSLYIEGGSSVLASAFESGIVNKVYAAIAPKIIGGKNAVTPVGGTGIEKMKDAIVLNRVTHEIVGNDVIFKGYI